MSYSPASLEDMQKALYPIFINTPLSQPNFETTHITLTPNELPESLDSDGLQAWHNTMTRNIGVHSVRELYQNIWTYIHMHQGSLAKCFSKDHATTYTSQFFKGSFEYQKLFIASLMKYVPIAIQESSDTYMNHMESCDS